MSNPPTRFCGSCGEANEAGSAFCTGCGAPLAAAPPRSAAPPITEAAPSQVRRRAGLVAPLVVAGALALAAVVYFAAKSSGPDKLTARLAESPLPAAAYQGWRLASAPSVEEEEDPAQGQVGLVTAHLDKSGGQGMAGFSFLVFQTAAQARSSYEDATVYDQAHKPGFTADQLAQLQAQVVKATGFTATCLRGGQGGTCHGLAGRTVVFVFMDSGEIDAALTATGELVRHVEALDK